MPRPWTPAASDDLPHRLGGGDDRAGRAARGGQLGAGKTTLAKGIVKGLGAAAPEEVSSPTFTLVHEYGAGPRVYHIDLYRIENARDLATLGLDELLERDAAVLVEWGERFPALWPPGRLEIRLEHAGEEVREIRIDW
ncbi:MAG: tRNA (adenosine(37)-N6)-threonylcarbamoyltransferase complex ATPase subunit type 1 TsaE [Bryobacteraceae bacterium]